MSKVYSVGLVGERFYQKNVKRAQAGEPVKLFLEPDNPHDPRAIAVADRKGRTLGYVPADNWLQRVIHDEGGGCTAIVKEVVGQGRPEKGIVILVELTGEPIEERAYS